MATRYKTQVDVGRMIAKLAMVPGLYAHVREKVVEQEAKGYIRTVVSITPPASANVKGTAAKKQGEESVSRDLRRIFAPVKLKGKRNVPMLFGETDPSGVGNNPPYVVDTKERHPDLGVIYDVRNGRRRGGRLTRGQRQAYYVSDKKFRAFERERRKKVGQLAAGYNAAAQRLGVAMPSWIKRHGIGKGSVLVRVTSGSYMIVIRNSVVYGRAQRLHVLAERAAQIQRNKLERRLPHLIKAELRKAGLS